ncbi:MAG TPA: hypothetical protein P5556_03420 [Candidatus Gastranaerophilales bacterium]|nr:hypothetical protein [Candidatus Gastranaerophilales bacterium]
MIFSNKKVFRDCPVKRDNPSPVGKMRLCRLFNFNKTHAEIFHFSTLLFIFGILGYAFWNHQGSILIDCGREAYIPEQILKGKVLFKDIFILYGPLSYQINAFLYKIFGIHLNTLYYAGIFNSLIIVSVFYWISRKLTSIKTSWLACFLLMTICIFYFHITGYIFPYAYAAVYALSSFLISVLFCMYYIEKSKPVFLSLAALFMGISAVNKIDYILFSGVLFLIAFYFKALQKKDLIKFISCFLLIPAISWGIEFSRGLELKELFYYLQTMNDFVNSSLFKYFYANNTGLYPSDKFLWALSKVSRIFIYNFGICMLTFYAFFFIFAKLPQFKGKISLQILAFTALYIVFPKDFFKEIGKTTALGWLGVETAVILAVFIIFLLISKRLFKGNIIKNFSTINLNDKFFILICAAGVLSSLKSFFFINIHIFGTFFVPFLLLASVVFWLDKFPNYIKFIDKKAWEQAGFTILFLLGLIFMLNSLNNGIKGYNYPIQTNRGKIYAPDFLGATLDELISYVNREIPAKSSFLMMPEGLMINFLTARDSNNRFYSLTPNFVEAFEEKIVQEIKRNKPDYIFITSQDTGDYGFKQFSQDYGLEIYNYVNKNYFYLHRIEKQNKDPQPLWIDIYKLKNGEI